MMWLEMNGVFVIANIRGGGEYGPGWHDAGRKLEKPKSLDDFIAAARFLINEGYTRPGKLAIRGSSNGGLLVAACMVQEPELFGACLPSKGIMDLLRYPRLLPGRSWVEEYGSPDDPREFEVLRSYSPYHNIKHGISYPATWVTTHERDDRVAPSHSYKFVARLQEAHAGHAPILIRTAPRAGHCGGLHIEDAADRFAFLAEVLDMDL